MASILKNLRVLGETFTSSLGLMKSSVSTPRLAIMTWLRELRGVENQPLRGRVAILAIRNATWIEWATYTACWMRKLGYGPVILYSSKDVNRALGQPGKQTLSQRLLSGDYLKQIARIPDVILIDLDAEAKPEASEIAAYEDFSNDYANTMAAYDMRLEEHEQGEKQQDYLKEVAKDKNILAEYGAMIEKVFRRVEKQHNVKRIISFSGLIGVTTAIGEAASRCGWNAAFCESWAIKRGHMLISINAPALVYDIESWLKTLGEWNEDQSKEIEKFLAFQETSELGEDSEWLKNYHRFQRSSVNEDLSEDLKAFLTADGPLFMLAPNCVGDSATLRVRTIFQSQREWINEVCSYFRSHPEMRLIIRAHPDELFYFQRNKIEIMMGQVAEQAAAGAPNIHVVKGNEDISTYSLIPHAQGGLIWMSTVGVDMAVRNCPVLAAATPKYHGLGIVHEPRSRDEYFDAIEKLAASSTGTSDQQKEMGKKYLTILAKEFSYEAFSKTYRGRDINLSDHPKGSDCDTFYRILSGEYPQGTRPPARSGA